jgi:hypothetical protein
MEAVKNKSDLDPKVSLQRLIKQHTQGAHWKFAEMSLKIKGPHWINVNVLRWARNHQMVGVIQGPLLIKVPYNTGIIVMGLMLIVRQPPPQVVVMIMDRVSLAP